jgi:N-acetylglucosaminyl-diphospho-decaprenol L-rhamnosyltransferase
MERGAVADPSSQEPPVAVAVVSWNTRALLEACLDSLEKDATEGLAEVWVVDNASSDGSAAIVRERYPWVTLIEARENLGFGRAVNLVASETSTPWLVPANADVRVSPGAVRRLLLEGERHPEAAVIAPRLVRSDGSTQHSAYPFPTIPLALAYVSGATRVSDRLARHWRIDQGFDPERGGQVGWAVGAFLLVRRAAWDAAGGFDEGQWMYAEDLDLGWRLAQAGWTTRYEPDALVFHHESAAAQQAWGDERHARWHAMSYAWLERRRGFPVARAMAAINVVGYFLRAAVHSALALLGRRSSRQARGAAVGAMRAHMLGLRRQAYLKYLR